MGDSVLEQIAQNVEETLQNITQANGYTFDLAVSRATKLNPERHLSAYIFQLSPDDDEFNAPINNEQWKQSFAVVVYVMPTETDTTAVDVFNNEIAAAMHKELMADYSRGGLAINTIIKPTLYFPPVEGECCGITFQFDVFYRHAQDDPFRQGN